MHRLKIGQSRLKPIFPVPDVNPTAVEFQIPDASELKSSPHLGACGSVGDHAETQIHRGPTWEKPDKGL